MAGKPTRVTLGGNLLVLDATDSTGVGVLDATDGDGIALGGGGGVSGDGERGAGSGACLGGSPWDWLDVRGFRVFSPCLWFDRGYLMLLNPKFRLDFPCELPQFLQHTGLMKSV